MVSIPSELAENDADGLKSSAIKEACAKAGFERSPEIKREQDAILAAYNLTEKN